MNEYIVRVTTIHRKRWDDKIRAYNMNNALKIALRIFVYDGYSESDIYRSEVVRYV